MIEIHIFTEDRFPIDTFVVDGDLVFGYVIVNYHLARPNDDHLSNLLRVEPADMDVGNNLSRILEVKKNDIVDSLLHIGHALSGD